MSGDETVTDHRRPSNGDIYSRLDRIEDLLTRRLDRQEGQLDDVTSRLDRIDGGMSMVKWLGPTGVVAVVFAIAQAAGLIH